MPSYRTPFFAFLVAVCAGWGAPVHAQDAPAPDRPPLDVVTSFSVLADLTERIGGNRVSVSTLVGPGEDAHVYEPSPADAARVAEADVVVVNGLGLEGFIDRLIDASGTGARIVTAARGIDALKEADDGHDHDDHDHDHGARDPHAWHAVGNVQRYVSTIAEELCAADQAGCEAYQSNTAAYNAELEALERELGGTFGAIPEDRRTVIVSHDAFSYLADAYGLTLLAPLGVSTDTEASAADVARLIDQVREQGASALFVENISDPRLVERIAAETDLVVGGTLYSDALSDSDGPAATYIDMMRHNAGTIARAVAGG